MPERYLAGAMICPYVAGDEPMVLTAGELETVDFEEIEALANAMGHTLEESQDEEGHTVHHCRVHLRNVLEAVPDELSADAADLLANMKASARIGSKGFKGLSPFCLLAVRTFAADEPLPTRR